MRQADRYGTVGLSNILQLPDLRMLVGLSLLKGNDSNLAST